jgi:hypothetical protein
MDPLKDVLVRESLGDRVSKTYLILYDGVASEVDAEDFHTKHNIASMIRIAASEYDGIDAELPYVTHFNMEYGGHIPGSRYAFPRIEKHGFFRTPEDQSGPILSIENILVGTCTASREKVGYDELTNADFAYSMRHIKSIEELRSAILKRYSKSMPDLSADEILRRGVGVTTVKLEGILR